MTDHRLREILRALRTERIRIEELIADFQMFAAESTLQKRRPESGTSAPTRKRHKRRPSGQPAGPTR
jgi:hypothetical protein